MLYYKLIYTIRKTQKDSPATISISLTDSTDLTDTTDLSYTFEYLIDLKILTIFIELNDLTDMAEND